MSKARKTVGCLDLHVDHVVAELFFAIYILLEMKHLSQALMSKSFQMSVV